MVGQLMQILGVQILPMNGIRMQICGRQKCGRILFRSNEKEKLRLKCSSQFAIRTMLGGIKSTAPFARNALAVQLAVNGPKLLEPLRVIVPSVVSASCSSSL